MRYPEFYYRWEWQLQSSPEALWPLVSDTNRFNRETGIPALILPSTKEASLPNARQRLRFSRLGVVVEWEEEPFEWVRPYVFGVNRHYIRGPVKEMRALVTMTPQENGGTHLLYEIWARPSNLLGWLVTIPGQIGVIFRYTFDKTLRRYDRLAARRRSVVLPVESSEPVYFAPGGRERIEKARQTLIAQGADAGLVAKLTETIEQADALTLARIRPYALADDWGASRRSVLELCLLATRTGLLEFQWELLCPLCRNDSETRPSLGDIRSQVHCPSCNIDFTVNFDRSVEVTFHPNPAIRPIETRPFCIGGPQVTPHVVAQQLLPAHTTRTVELPLEAGRYRVRTHDRRGGQFLSAAPNGASTATFCVAEESDWPQDEPQVSTRAQLKFENDSPGEELFILERMAWTDQAATAAEVTALQVFRDLFANEALRPGEQIQVGTLAVVFTDLRGSTQIYRQIGDATAFGLVMDHFDILRNAISAQEGSIVKTIGDSVMAVFPRPVAALRAMLQVQQSLATPVGSRMALRLKAGIHVGPCIAVTLNDRLDYFGSTVNAAARLEGLSSGADVIISGDVRADPEVTALLDGAADTLTIEPVDAKLKGFESEKFELWRLTRQS
jgi:class 3 adenylate cyclase